MARLSTLVPAGLVIAGLGFSALAPARAKARPAGRGSRRASVKRRPKSVPPTKPTNRWPWSMMSRYRPRGAAAALLLPALLVVWTRPSLAAEPEVRARWEDLPALVEGRDVEMVLRNGVYVRGRAGEVTPNALRVRVKKTSDPAVIPKGPTPIPREEVSVLTVRWRKGSARVLMTLGMGAGTYYLLALPFGVDGDAMIDALGSAGAAATYGGFYVAGYMIGRMIDAKRMRVVVVSAPPTCAPSHVGGPHSAGGECERGI
jgi:hypothetical protein